MATLTLYHDTRSGKDTFPIKMRIAHKKEKAYISLGIKVAVYEWDEQTSQIIGNKKAKTYNSTIIARMGAANATLANLDLLGKTNKMTAAQIKVVIENGGEIAEDKDSYNFYEYYNSSMNSKTKDKTRSSYKQTLINLEKFDPNIKERTFEDRRNGKLELLNSIFQSASVKAAVESSLGFIGHLLL